MGNKYFANTHKYDSFSTLTKLVSNSTLLYLSSNYNIKLPSCKIMLNYPRKMIQDPNEAYVLNSSNIDYVYTSFEIYKDNICSYLIYYAGKLNSSVNTFVKFLLTTDSGLFGNQPIKINNKHYSDIFCHLHNGKYFHSAIDLFGNTQN